MARLKFSPQYIVLLAFTALVAAPLTAPGYFMFAHDARHTVYFMQMFDAALRDGALYPRWATDMVFGYGYPVWLILAPLPYYAAEFFHLLGLDFPAAIKAVEIGAWFASASGMYWFASRVMDRNAGLVAGVAYLLAPYHVVDLYVRGAMPEFLAFVFPPFVLWAIYQIFSTRRAFYVPLAALAYGGMILTHVQMTVLFSPVILGYILVLWWSDRRQTADDRWQTADDRRQTADDRWQTADDRRQTTELSNHFITLSLRRSIGSFLFRSILALAWGVAIAAVFFLPVVAEQKHLTNDPLIGGFFNFRLHFLNPSQLLSPFWGYGYAGINGNDQFSLQLGVMPLFFGILALFTLKRAQRARAQLIYFACVTLAAVIAMLAVSTPLWELAAPIVAFVQFPWRVLFVSAFALAFLAGAAVRAVGERCGEAFATGEPFRAALIFSLLIAFSMFPFARPQYTATQFTWNTMMDFQVKDRELLGDTEWIQERPQTSPLVEQYRAGVITTKAVIVQGAGSVELLERRPSGDTIRVEAATPARVMFYTRYFPGWTATLDGAPAAIAPYGAQGLIALDVPAGTHTVTTHFGTTRARTIGALVSCLALLAALVVLWRARSPRQRTT
ncbi:hypothetical protein FBQ82_19850 [Anaerolineae bacterium CFX7]|nr:hypothetical protein [Anaerolineae bacterium CFX7]